MYQQNKEQTFQVHSNLDTFLQSTGLAVIPATLVHRALPLALTQPRLSSTTRPLVESTAPIARVHSIMLSSTSVSTHFTSCKNQETGLKDSFFSVSWNFNPFTLKSGITHNSTQFFVKCWIKHES